ncbi:MAG TPA: glycosyltransferase N-terminal domain-containing protein [Bacteroidales bacterium]|nr:glycosyltransferase N-terminal domain-containing protein [Bacteroidales bacterium]HQH18571.1 glycosyltransferase N-terminal domain-containing protein [Bacteroidales bacterium]HQI45110.1 glycosyltransferase N-terminal domain-containing protein [Bacteroidales bacterium]
MYKISIYVYYIAIYIASVFRHKKAVQWINGRKNLFSEIEKKVKTSHPLAWFHCASLGEFEQGRPLMEEFRKQYPTYKILLTFFSPSGYEVRKNYNGADYIFYLPIDTPANAKRFLALTNPTLVFFIKYEFWFNYIKQIKKNAIPFFVISSNFRKSQHYFKWYGFWFRKQLKGVSRFFVQNNNSLQLLNNIHITNVTVSGDTRFDRVMALAQNTMKLPLIEKFCDGKDIFIAGSTWEPDEDILIKLINSEKTKYKFIIAPHMVDKPHIASLVEKIKKGHVVLYSEADPDNVLYAKVLIIDCIGILSNLYRYGKIAYIGGGFGSGIHNILEAATYGMPVIFGHKYHKFIEAVELIEKGGAYCIHNENEFMQVVMDLITNNKQLREKSAIAREYVQKNIGATQLILKEISRYIKC